MTFLSGAYNATAAVGTTVSYLQFGAGFLFSLVFIIIGVVLLFKKKSKDDVPYKTMGGLFLGFGSIILLIASVSFYLVKTYKPVAALSGTENIINIAKDVL